MMMSGELLSGEDPSAADYYLPLSSLWSGRACGGVFSPAGGTEKRKKRTLLSLLLLLLRTLSDLHLLASLVLIPL